MAAPPQQQQPPGPSQLSREEARVMRECNQESFYSRCVPFSAVLMTGTLYMVRTGRWRGSGAFGPGPKMAAAGVIGYIAGKLSYIDTCKERLMALPDSKIGEMLRLRDHQRRGGDLPQAGFSDVTPTATAAAESEPAASTWPLPPQRTDAGLDDYYRPTLDSPDTLQSLTTDDLPAAQQHTTYDQLRRQNRGEAEARLRRGAAEPAAAAQYQPPMRPPPPPPNQQAPARQAGKVNKYGDAWED